MNWVGISLLCSLMPNPLETYPSKSYLPGKVYDPADYPDLTSGLSNDEIEATLHDLSLDDLSSLDKLLDENVNNVEDFNASPREKHRRQIKVQRSQMYDKKQSMDDETLDDEEDQPKEKESTKCKTRTKCPKKKTTTTSCSTTATPRTTTCSTPTTDKCEDTEKRKLGGFLDDDLDIEKSQSKKLKKPKKKYEDVCDADDAECLQRNLDRLRQQKNSFQDYNIDDFPSSYSSSPLDYDIGENKLDGMEELGNDMPKGDLNSLKPNKDLNVWNNKEEISSNFFNMDYNKAANTYANYDSNYKVAPKMTQTWSQANAEPEEQVMPYEGNREARVSNENEGEHKEDHKVDIETLESEDGNFEQEKYEDMTSDDRPQGKVANEEQEIIADKEKQNDGSDGDSFIAQNALDPPRYLIQTQCGDYFLSDNEPEDQLFHEDQNQKQMVNKQKYEVDRTDEGEESYLESQFGRRKRENKKLDDAPENANESYLKKLMDSFPRDQNSQNNVNFALKEMERAHFRVKRS